MPCNLMITALCKQLDPSLPTTTLHSLHSSSILPAVCIHHILVIKRYKKQIETTRGRMIRLHLLMFLCLCSSISSSDAVQLILFNNCEYSVWPGVIGNSGFISPNGGGFHLGVHEEAILDVPNGWSGRIWGRKGCCFNEEGKGSCETGDCGGLLHCGQISGKSPATVVEMTFGSNRSPLHFYDVSLVDGFNLPVKMSPVGEGIGCGIAGCEVDLNACCPSRFEVRLRGKIVGCKSACQALRTDKYCCTGEYRSRGMCKPTLFSHLFKSICPRAYSFPYDVATSQKTCRASHYLVTFCPLPK